MAVGGPLSLAAWIALVGAVPVAASGPVPIRIELEAPADCPDVHTFYAEIRGRTDRVRLARDNETGLRLTVRLSRTDGTFQGELRVIDEQGETDTRRVEGASCEEVVQALSLTAALAVDPTALVPPSPPVERSREKPPPAPLPARPPRIICAEKEHWVELDAQAAVAKVVSPQFELGGGILVRVSRHDAGKSGPTLGIGLLELHNGVFEPAAQALYRWLSMVATACPGGHVMGGVVEIQPCAMATAGYIVATGRSVSHPTSVARSWWSAGALAHGSIVAGAGIVLNIDLGLVVPLVRRRFITRTPDRVVGESPLVSPFGAIGLGYRF